MIEPAPRERPTGQRHFAGFCTGLLACLAILAIQINRYWFTCDDAYISFRYARNLAAGHGLVFNPGFERVEGYTNFLWVLLLAAGRICGIAPERGCHFLSNVASLGIVALVTWYCLKALPAGASFLWALWPALFLAMNRTFATWCTSGLETKLFDLFVVAGVLCAIHQTQQLSRTTGEFPWAAMWFALAALTRPEGILMGACALGASHALTTAQRRSSLRRLGLDLLLFMGVVGGHFVFRRLYYGDWLPNTYYAKVGGRAWWAMGWTYLTMFALEYCLALWLPVIVIGIASAVRSSRAADVIVPAAAIVPYAVYIAAVGGDHFEYRPLSVLLPLLSLMAIPCLRIIRSTSRSVLLATWLLAISIIGGAIPEIIHQDFPSGYRPGFPGVKPRDSRMSELIDSQSHPALWRLPFVGVYLKKINSLAVTTSRNFVCLRQEEHRRFSRAAVQEGRWLATAIADGSLPRDIHLAAGCVGAISYYADVRILDLMGLTDRAVARSPSVSERMMAHEKMASPEYIRSMGADLRAIDDVSIVFPNGHPKLMRYAQEYRLGIGATVFAKLPNGLFLAARPMQGIEAFKTRAPNLHFLSAAELLSEQLKAAAADQTRDRREEFGIAYDLEFVDQSDEFLNYGDLAAAKINLQRALTINPSNLAAQASRFRIGIGRNATQVQTRSPVR